MKKNGMVALLLMGSISMYGQTTSKMTLSGRVKGFTDTPTLICDLSMEHVKPDTLLIRPDGTFSQEIVIPGVKNAFFKVHDGKDNPHSYLLYLAPDKSLHVDIVKKQDHIKLVYSGDTGPETDYTNIHRETVTLSQKCSNNTWRDIPDFDACVKYVDIQLAPVEKALTKVKNQTFVAQEKQGWKKMVEMLYFNYAIAKQQAGVDMRKDKDFMEFVNKINFNDTLQVAAIVPYIDWYVTANPDLYKKDEELPIGAVKIRVLGELTQDQGVRNNISKTLLTAQLFPQMLGADISETIPFVYREFLKISTDPQLREMAVKQLKIIDNTTPGTLAASLRMRDRQGREVTLDQLVGHGKYTYIDFWATWCGPCCKEIPFIEKLVEQYQDIRFVSISIDTDVETWEKKLASDKPAWEQYIVPGKNQIDYADTYGITNIPRFMIFDKEGRLLDAKAPRPSETKIEELFNRWKPISSYQVSGNLKTPSDTLLVAYVNTQTGRTKLDTVPSNAGAFGFDALDKNTTYAVGIIGKPKYGDVQGLMAAMFSPIRLVIIPGEKAVVTGDFRNYEITGSTFYTDLQKAKKELEADQKVVDEKQMELNALKGKNSPIDAINAVEAEIDVLKRKISDTAMEYMKTNPKQYASAVLIECVVNEKRREAFDLLDSCVKEGPMKTYAETLVKMAEAELYQKEAKKKVQVGMVAPEFKLKDLNGKDVSLTDFRGKYVVLDFWGSWCVWCIKGFPDMKKSYEKHKVKIEFISIACRDSDAKWRTAVKENALPWVQLFNDGKDIDVAALYAVNGYPTKCIIDPEGKIVRIFSGESAEFYTYLDDLLK